MKLWATNEGRSKSKFWSVMSLNLLINLSTTGFWILYMRACIVFLWWMILSCYDGWYVLGTSRGSLRRSRKAMDKFLQSMRYVWSHMRVFWCCLFIKRELIWALRIFFNCFIAWFWWSFGKWNIVVLLVLSLNCRGCKTQSYEVCGFVVLSCHQFLVGNVEGFWWKLMFVLVHCLLKRIIFNICLWI